MNKTNELILKSIETAKNGQLPLCNGWKQLNNVSNQDFIAVVKHHADLLKKYNEKQQETNEVIILAIADFDYIIAFLTDRWSHKENSIVPNKFMTHNPMCNKWRKISCPKMLETSLIHNYIVYSSENY